MRALKQSIKIGLCLALTGAAFDDAFGIIVGKGLAGYVAASGIVPAIISNAMTAGFFGPADQRSGPGGGPRANAGGPGYGADGGFAGISRRGHRLFEFSKGAPALMMSHAKRCACSNRHNKDSYGAGGAHLIQKISLFGPIPVEEVCSVGANRGNGDFVTEVICAQMPEFSSNLAWHGKWKNNRSPISRYKFY